jgi:hypothetical protein
VPSLAALSPAWLDLTDAEVFPISRTRGDFYRSREQRVPRGCRVEVRPQLFRSRGTPLLLVLHPWKTARSPVRLGLERSGESGLTARLPAGLSVGKAGEVVSLELVRPTRERATKEVLVQPGGQSLPLQYAGRHGRKTRFMTPRFRSPGGLAGIRLPASAKAAPESFELLLWRWSDDRAACGLK